MGKYVSAVCVALAVLGAVCPSFAFVVVEAKPAGPVVSAEAAALIDVDTGRILWSHQGDKPMLIASTTKIMTAIIAIEYGNLADQVTVGKNAAGKEGSSLYLKRGEKMSLEHLLYGMMLRSGNDAATAIAEHVGGSVEGFAVLMNQKAAEIGMTNTHFVNPHGLNEEGHYSTANDMAKLTAYALQNPVFREIVKTRVKKVPNPNEDWDYTWYNKNKMLAMYEGADGVKTGYTKLAGRCLVSSATRNGRQLAAVTLNAPNDWIDHTRMLDYGFTYFSWHTLAEEGQRFGDQQQFVAARTFRYPLAEDEVAHVRSEVTSHPESSLRSRLGEAGTLTFYLNEERIGSIPLIRSETGQAFYPGGEAPAAQNGFFPVFKSLVKELFRWST